MKKIVVKFGGSNLKKKDDFQKIVKIIKNYNRPLIVVLSGFYGITNYLTEAVWKARNDEYTISVLKRFFNKVKNDIVKENIKDEKLCNTTLDKLCKSIDELERYLIGINCIKEVPEFIEDVVLSYGERFSSLILSAILQDNGIDTEEALPENIGLLTDGEYGNATVDLSSSEDNVKKNLSKDKIYVVPGFYGVSKEGKITLLGRGGSDYSAASIAYCVDAESLDIWKDVDGFLSGDPKIIQNPKRLERLTYTEAAELAYFGAKILHPRTVEPLKEKHIPIRIFNVDKTDNGIKPCSTINSKGIISEEVIKSVTYSDDSCLLKLKGPGIGIKAGILAKVTTHFDNAGINIKSVFTSQIAINFLLSLKDLNKAYEIVKELHLNTVNEIETIENISVIAAVGEGVVEKEGVAARMFTAVARKGINVKIISLGASQVVSYFIVDKKDRDGAIKEIHNEFFSKQKEE